MASKNASDMRGLSIKNLSSASLAIGAGFLALLILALYLILRPGEDNTPRSYDVGLHPFLTETGLEVGYRPQEPVSDMVLGLPASAIGALTVTMGEALALEERSGQVAVKGDEPFDLVSIVIDRSVETPDKAYPLVQYGTEAAVFNLANWRPVQIDGNEVAVSGQQPRFQWVGIPTLWQGENINMLYDPGLPPAIQAMIGNSVAILNDYYKTALGGELSQAPQLMLLYSSGQDGQITIEGDTVPGQSLIRFVGGGLREEGQEARRRVQENIAHELFHLWQLEKPGVSASPDWLHEGAAQAVGLESLYITEKYADADYSAMLERTRAGCANALEQGPLSQASSRGSHQASYDCGTMIWTALASQRDGATVVETWRAFTAFAEEHGGGQSADALFAFAGQWSGSDGFTASLRQFVNANYSAANGRLIIDGLFAGDL